MMRDSFIFYKSFFEAMEDMDDTTLADTIRALCKYALYDEDTDIKGWGKSVISMAKPQIDANIKRRSDGAKGGRPKKEKPVVVESEKTKKPVVIEKSETEKPNANVNVNVNVNNKRNIKEKDDTPYTDIINYFNEKTGKHYRSSTPSTRQHIHARFAEGRTLDDFKSVIDKKSAEWLGTDMEKHLCPDTLFGSKFEKYLNQPDKVAKIKKGFNNFQGRDYGDMTDLSRKLIMGG